MGRKGRKHWRDRQHDRNRGDRPRFDDRGPQGGEGQDFREPRPRSGHPDRGDFQHRQDSGHPGQGDRDSRQRPHYPDWAEREPRQRPQERGDFEPRPRSGYPGQDRPDAEPRTRSGYPGQDRPDAEPRPRSGYPGQDRPDAEPRTRSGYPGQDRPDAEPRPRSDRTGEPASADAPHPTQPGGEDGDRGRNISSGMRRTFLGARADVSIVLLLHNAEGVLENLLASLNDQRPSREVEILAVESDSKDRTPLLLRSRGIRSLYVPASKTLTDVAMSTAEGGNVVFLCQDSFPVGTGWLAELLRPFSALDDVGISYGRLIADADVPPYPRGLVAARPHISGRQRLLFEPDSKAAGGRFLPHTNVAVNRKLFAKAGSLPAPGADLVAAAYRARFSKAYVPEAAAILKGEIPSALLEVNETSLPLGGLAGDAVRLWHILAELSEHGDLPSGQKGDAYLFALRRFLDSAGTRVPAFGRVARTLKLA
ncbi:MAG: hypothetical protein FJ109_11870 [Deltaproteobacteria bacterium]|nr:hypothetical protein [Deltaproteobacteria bacterium]